MLVVGLLALLASLAWPIMERRYSAAQLPESGVQFRSLLTMARASAMMDGCRYRVRFEPKQQHPVVEYEKDPFKAPGKYEPVKTDWTADERLLGDVQVHEIRGGRPEYTLPFDDEPQTSDVDELNAMTDEQAAADTAEPQPDEEAPAVGVMAQSDVPIDEARPPVVFESDGSTDWATLVLAAVPPGDELTDKTPQLWIEIDGRTGLVTIREPLTEAQMADASLRVPKSKLRPPEAVFGATQDLSIDVTTQQPSLAGGQAAGGAAHVGTQGVMQGLTGGSLGKAGMGMGSGGSEAVPSVGGSAATGRPQRPIRPTAQSTGGNQPKPASDAGDNASNPPSDGNDTNKPPTDSNSPTDASNDTNGDQTEKPPANEDTKNPDESNSEDNNDSTTQPVDPR